MTLEQWLQDFTSHAAQLPGWQLMEGRLRRLHAHGRVLACPLLAQWQEAHPERPVTNNHSLLMQRLWGGVLERHDVDSIMDAADYPPAQIPYDQLRALRAQLLAACGVEEKGE